ncbi:MAG: radical SAM protein, partial [Desulfobacteraceae bacterium]
MKITFITPKSTQYNPRTSKGISDSFKSLIKKSALLQQRMTVSKKMMGCLGLLTIAAVVPDDIEVEFFDENFEEIDYESRHFDLIALGGNIGQLNRIFYLCDMFKKKNIPVVAGGVLASTFPDQYLKRGISIVKGEGEELFKRFLYDFKHGQVKKVYDEQTGITHIDLKDSPIPRFDLAAKYDYKMVGVHISRGCPYQCNFCQVSAIFGREYRLKPVSRIVQEIKEVKSYWPDAFFYFYDDNPFFNRTFAVELFKQLYEKENISLGAWGTSGNITLYKDTELMHLITSKGSLSFYGVGIESLSKND